ncbi:MAG TPA: PaaI family thioesterase [Gaiellaceae bacterium]|nr:PaaI family thioesterase [Gaiellaceae bacterium]
MAGERTRTYSWQDPLAALEVARGLSGLEIVRRIVAGELPPPPIAEVLGMRLVEAEPGRAVFEGDPGEQHYNIVGTVHAGFTTTLLDSAMGCALATTLDAGVGWTTLELKANFTRPITVETGVVRCTGTVIHPGRRVATTEARLEDTRGRLLAHATSTILVASS